MYGILPQSAATDVNLSTSIKQWLLTQVKLQYDTQATALGLNNGYQATSEGKWTVDTNGMYIFEGLGPTDPKLYERVPCISYQIDDAKSVKPPVPTGCGDVANYEYVAILLCCVPAPLVADDGSAEPDLLSRATMRTLLRNAIIRTHYLPIADHSQPATGSPALYPRIGTAELFDQRMIAMPNELQQMLVNKRERFDVTFTLRWPVTATN